MLASLYNEDALAGCRVLGEGDTGKVYQVPLQEDLVVAIKCVRHEDPDPAKSHVAKRIRAELNTLGVIRHRNVVQLLAYIFKSDSHLMVYEYMRRGTLHDALQQMACGKLTLSWPERHRILCGVAQALVGLHRCNASHVGSFIVHRDLNPSNIFLDQGYEAKLGGFGLAAIVPSESTHGKLHLNVVRSSVFTDPELRESRR